MSNKQDTAVKNVAAERAVLSGICKFGLDALTEVEDLLREESFTEGVNKVVFKCLRHALTDSNKVEFADLLSSATTLNLFEIVNKKENLEHVRAVFNMPCQLDSVRQHAETLVKLEFSRSLQNKLRDIYRSLSDVSGDESLSEIMSLAEMPIQELSLDYIRESHGPQRIGDNIEEYIEYLANNPTDNIGLGTGFPEWDESIGGGLRRQCVDVIGARLKQGKSFFADNVAAHVARQGIPVLMLDTEMGTEDHHHRLLSLFSGLNSKYIAKGKFVEHPVHNQKVREAAQVVKHMNYHYQNVSGRQFDEILAIMRRWIMKTVGYDENGRLNDCLIIYDYLKLMNDDALKSMQEFQVMGFQMTRLHNFCVKYDCPCLTFVQLNRDGLQKEDTSVISQSDRIGWLCTSFTIFKSKTEDEINHDGADKGNKKLIPVVSRHGEGMGDGGYICVQMDGAKGSVKELGTIYELKNKEKIANTGFQIDGELDEAIESA